MRAVTSPDVLDHLLVSGVRTGIGGCPGRGRPGSSVEGVVLVVVPERRGVVVAVPLGAAVVVGAGGTTREGGTAKVVVASGRRSVVVVVSGSDTPSWAKPAAPTRRSGSAWPGS